MEKNRWKLALAVTLGLFVFSFQFVAASSISVENVVELMNQARIKENLDPLVVNDKLNKAAQDKAADMLAHGYFAHTSPQGLTPWDWINKNKYNYKYAGENLAMGFSQAEEEQQAWMASATHRQNILNPHYQEIGVAVRQGNIDGRLTTIAVQEFGSRPDFVASGPRKVGADEVSVADKKIVLGEEHSAQSTENNSLLASPQNNLAVGWKDGLGNIKNKIGSSHVQGLLAFGAAGTLWLTVMGGMLVAGYLAVDSLVLEYLGRSRQNQRDSGLALNTLSPKEDLDILKNLSIDASKLQIIYLQQMKQRK